MLGKLMFGFFKNRKKPIKQKTEEELEMEKATNDFVESVKKLAEHEKQSKKTIDEAIDFDLNFYGIVAGDNNFKILMIPDQKGTYPTENEIEDTQLMSVKDNYRLIFQLNELDKEKNKIGIVFGPYTNLTGIIYPTDNTGYHG